MLNKVEDFKTSCVAEFAQFESKTSVLEVRTFIGVSNHPCDTSLLDCLKLVDVLLDEDLVFMAKSLDRNDRFRRRLGLHISLSSSIASLPRFHGIPRMLHLLILFFFYFGDSQ